MPGFICKGKLGRTPPARLVSLSNLCNRRRKAILTCRSLPWIVYAASWQTELKQWHRLMPDKAASTQISHVAHKLVCNCFRHMQQCMAD